ncbi:patatin-like protein 2 [Hevea brasiliensis]|uniref:patatin-like protein 2 n=1 Tax=Hevea brasiliensis TaxID=3981 RepID=UPI0026005331|nr:patatin-like protein 2 [Hevea brasiliensis]
MALSLQYSTSNVEGQGESSQSTEQCKKVTILSIDGGGIRCIIPATILHALEKHLQKLDGPNARIANYFDIIAGVSTGSILTPMLTAPENRRCDKLNWRPSPKFDASKFVSFYERRGEGIFGNPIFHVREYPKKIKEALQYILCRFASPINWFEAAMAILTRHGPSALRYAVGKELGQVGLRETVTKLVIPAFRIRKTKPVIFTSDMTLAALCEATKTYGNERNYKNYLVLSLGTGQVDLTPYSGQGLAEWLFKEVVRKFRFEFLCNRVNDAVELYMSRLFHCDGFSKNYLRIQEYELKGEVEKMDNVSRVNIFNLKNIGQCLLHKNVTVVNPDTGNLEKLQYYYKDALAEFAQKLVKEKKNRVPRI